MITTPHAGGDTQQRLFALAAPIAAIATIGSWNRPAIATHMVFEP